LLSFKEAILRIVIAIVSLALAWPAWAQQLVDPDKVAPEYREAAVKRRAEQINQLECAKKANGDHVLPRDRTAFINHCLDEVETGKH
jgi:hypothetical protein